jgi:hypothetical protein
MKIYFKLVYFRNKPLYLVSLMGGGARRPCRCNGATGGGRRCRCKLLGVLPLLWAMASLVTSAWPTRVCSSIGNECEDVLKKNINQVFYFRTSACTPMFFYR